MDAIFHVVRTFADDLIAHVEGDVEAIRDIEIIHEELRLKDIEFITKQLDAAKKALRGNESDKNKKFELETIQKAYEWLTEQKKDIRHGDWNNKEVRRSNVNQGIKAAGQQDNKTRRNREAEKMLKLLFLSNFLYSFSRSKY